MPLGDRWSISFSVIGPRFEEDDGIPLLVEVQDAWHEWFCARLRIIWCRSGEFVLLRVAEVWLVPHNFLHAIPPDVISDPLWWNAVIDESHDYLLAHARSFDPRCPDPEILSTGWEDRPFTEDMLEEGETLED